MLELIKYGIYIYIGAVNFTITLPFTMNLHALWLQLTNFFRLRSKLGRGRGRCIVKTAAEREY